MLILKRPIQLQSISGIQIYADKLGEKIIANYQLIGMEITSADLLHMMVQEPELFLNSEPFGIMTIERPVHVTNQIKLEMISQLVNRFMLYFSPDFTYQDEVFVASILQKIGILDVNEFMQQIHRHMDHNLLLAKLFHSYGSQKKVAETIHLFQTRLQQSYQETKETNLQNAWDKDYKFAYYLHNEVFERLMTAECNHIIDSYYCQIDKRKATVQGVREAVWAEQADVIQLSQMRKRMFGQTNPVVWQEDIYYERKHFAQESLTEEIVVQRIVAAILENMVQKLHGVWLRGKNGVSSISWRDYTQTFCRSATDVFERFWYFQRKQTIAMPRYEAYLDRTHILIQNEWKLTQLLEHLNFFDNYADKEKVEREVVLSIWENQNLQKQLTGRIQLEERLAVQNYLRDIDLQQEQEYQAELNSFQEIRNQWTVLKQQMDSTQNQLIAHRKQNEESTIEETQIAQHYLDILQTQEIQNSLDRSISQEVQNRVDIISSQEMHNRADLFANQERRNNIDILQRRETQAYFMRDLARNWNDKLPVLHHYVVHFSKQRQHITVEDLLLTRVNHTDHKFNFYFDKVRDSLQWQQISRQEPEITLDLTHTIRNEELSKTTLELPYIKQNQDKKIDEQESKIAQDLIYRKQNQNKKIDEQESKIAQDLIYKKQNQDKKIGNQEESFNMSLEYLQNQQRSHYNYMDEFLQKYAEFVSEQEVPFSENKRLLDEINQHNLQMKHRLDSEDSTSINKNVIRRVVVDQKKARQSALRALENPQEALREIYTHATAIEEELPPELEKILRITDKNTQLFYRQLLGYQNVSLQREQNRTQDNNISSTDAKMQVLTGKETAGEIVFPNLIVEQLENTKRTISFDEIELTLKQIEEYERKIYLESIVQQSANSIKRFFFSEDKILFENLASLKNSFLLEKNLESFGDYEWKGIDFAHKPELQLTEYLEDLESRVLESADHTQQKKAFYAELEQLKQQQNEQRQLAQQQLQDIRQKLLRESEEQFTQMVNHSLKTQVHAISDIVYHELERRLKNEQRRRGY